MSTDITNHPVWEDVSSIIERADPVRVDYLDVTLHMGSQDYKPYQVLSLDYDRDYTHRHFDIIRLTVSMLETEFNYTVVPQKDTILVTVQFIPDNNTLPTIKRVFKAVLITQPPTLGEGTAKRSVDPSTEKFVNVSFQLLNRASEYLRKSTFSQIARDCRTDTFIQGALTHMASRVTLPDDEQLLGVDMVPGDNTVPRRTIILSQNNLRVFDLPEFIQNHRGGVYLDGIHHYIQDRHWYVYPKYRTSRFESVANGLTIVRITKGRLPFPDRSWYTDGDQTIILATDDAVPIVTDDAKQLSEGNGVRFALSKQIIHNFRQTDAGDASVDISRNVVEISVRDRKDGEQYAPLSKHRITDNVYREQSELADRWGTALQITWQNASLHVIYPGMPVKYLYMVDDKLVEVHGTVIAFDYLAKKKTPEATDHRVTHNANLIIYVEAPDLPVIPSELG